MSAVSTSPEADQALKGKRVASIGTGASAIQYVPAIQPDVEQLYAFQRTPPWVLPHTDRPIGAWERRLHERFPACGSCCAASSTQRARPTCSPS